MKTGQRVIAKQLSYVLANDTVEVALTKLGGHMAPVTFFRKDKAPIAPYYISPWQEEGQKIAEPVLRPLRGDLFCMPFGGNNKIGSENHVAHGETATSPWEPVVYARNGSVTELALKMETKVRQGRVTKQIYLVDGHNVVYTRHTLEGYKGAMCLGHHATLAVPPQNGSLLYSSSPIKFGYTAPSAPGPYAQEEYFCLPPAAKFKDLSKVPTIWKTQPFSDRSTFPAEKGFTDILSIFPKQKTGLGWNAAVFPYQGFLWFSIRNVELLNSTVLWMANHGRHGCPWNGRNSCLGIEDVCAFFAEGLAASSKKNLLTEQGIATSIALSPKKATVINYIQGVARIPAKFDRVDSVTFQQNDSACFTSQSGQQVQVPLKHSFAMDGELE